MSNTVNLLTKLVSNFTAFSSCSCFNGHATRCRLSQTGVGVLNTSLTLGSEIGHDLQATLNCCPLLPVVLCGIFDFLKELGNLNSCLKFLCFSSALQQAPGLRARHPDLESNC